MGRPRKDPPRPPERLRPAERDRRMAGSLGWAVIVVRPDGRRRVFMTFPPDAAGKARAANVVLALRATGGIAELLPASSLGWELR